MVIDIEVRETGKRDLLSFTLGGSEEAFWLDFL